MNQQKEAQKFDFKKEYKFLYRPSSKTPEIVQVPDFKYLMIDGRGYPGESQEFQDKIAVIYGLAYTIKFMFKLDKAHPFDFVVPPFSGLWWAKDHQAFIDKDRKNEWQWTIMILMPDQVTNGSFTEAKGKLKEKKNQPFLQEAYLQIYTEGKSAQIMHIGPYSDEGPNIKKLHDFFQQQGYTFNGKHHEIYLSDPRRCQPEKMKTIIRQPIIKI